MRRQRSMSQINERNKIPEKQLNKMETSNLPDAELKTSVIKELNVLNENSNKEIENIKMGI